MLDKILALVSMATMIGFVAIVLVWVNEPDLWIICLAVLAMGVYEFVSSSRTRGKNGADSDPST